MGGTVGVAGTSADAVSGVVSSTLHVGAFGACPQGPVLGATWDTLSNPGFRSPCDIVVVPGDDSKIIVGDGVTGTGFGQIFQSTNGGLNFTLKYTGPSSEVPTVWGNRLENNVIFAANWSNGGVCVAGWGTVISGGVKGCRIIRQVVAISECRGLLLRHAVQCA